MARGAPAPLPSSGRGCLATLREPTPEQASRWHKPRQSPVAARMKFIIDFLVEDMKARVTKRSDAATELVVDTGDGTTLRIVFRRDEIEVRLAPTLVAVKQGTEKLKTHAEHVDNASTVVEVLQLGTGFYVHGGDDLIGFDPAGACPSCGLEVFEWQDCCEICKADLYKLVPGEDEHDGRGRRVVEVLLKRKMIELVSPRGRRSVERTVSAFYAMDNVATEVLLHIFVEMADIAEVYCDEVELFRVLCRIR